MIMTKIILNWESSLR